jgi:hypothetical protein
MGHQAMCHVAKFAVMGVFSKPSVLQLSDLKALLLKR